MSGLPISAVLNPPDTRPPQINQPKFVDQGREYYIQWFNTYPYPCDEAEKERLDATHHTFYDVALDGHLHIASLRQGRLRILDVGYGTGIWAISMADKYPQAEIIAIDIGNDHPVFEGFEFRVDFRSGIDFTSSTWGLEGQEGTFDFIHAGCLCGSVPDWSDFYGKIATLLKPGTGQFEQVEFDWKPRCLDSSVPADSPVNLWWQCLRTASANFGKPIEYPEDSERLLEQAGFDIVKHNRTDIHSSEDRAASDDQRTQLCRWYRFFMFHPAFKCVKGLSMGLLTHQLRWSPEQVSALCSDVSYILNHVHSPWYHKFHVVTARKEMS